MKRVLPHICIVFSVVFLTLLIIDQLNSAMGFINNQLTKYMMMVSSVVVIVTSICYICDQRS